MAITTYSGDTAIIAALDDEPNDTGGLTAAQLKAKYDEAMTAFKTWFNATHIPELDAVHLPYIYGAATTIKQAMEALVAGVVPDDSVTEAMLKVALLSKIDGKLDKTGGTMAGDIVLSGAPTLDLHASTKKYVDDGLASRAQIATGTYAGAGTYGSGNPNSLTFGFTPKLIIINPVASAASGTSSVYSASFINGGASSSLVVYYDGQSVNTLNVTWGTTVSWYESSNAYLQMNISGVTYSYVAIGL